MKNGALSQRLFSFAYGLINVHKENANDGKRSYFLLAHIQSQSRPSIQMSKANAFNVRPPTSDIRRHHGTLRSDTKLGLDPRSGSRMTIRGLESYPVDLAVTESPSYSATTEYPDKQGECV